MTVNFFSPTMLKSYLNCRYIIFNEANKKKLGLKKKEKNISDLKKFESGNLHEDKYFEVLKKKYSKVINLKDLKISKEEKFLKMNKNELFYNIDVLNSTFLNYSLRYLSCCKLIK